MLMQPLFRNKDDQRFFEKNGFLKLKHQFLNDAEIKKLSDLFYGYDNKVESNRGFYVGMEYKDKSKVKTIMQKIVELVQPKLAALFFNYKPFIANYIVKYPDTSGVLLPHQDWTFIEDEVNNYAVTCWIPLVDVGMENGCVGVIRGSHKFLNSVRPSPSVSNTVSPLVKHSQSLLPYFEWIPMNKGEILLFDYRIFHASLPNTTDAVRPAIGIWMAENDAKFCHYYSKPGVDNVLLKYKVDEEFYIKYDNNILSEMYLQGKVIEDYEISEEINFSFKEISNKEMIEKVTAAGNVKKDIPASILNVLNDDNSRSKIKTFFKKTIYSLFSNA